MTVDGDLRQGKHLACQFYHIPIDAHTSYAIVTKMFNHVPATLDSIASIRKHPNGPFTSTHYAERRWGSNMLSLVAEPSLHLCNAPLSSTHAQLGAICPS